MDGVNRSDSSNPAKNVELKKTKQKQKEEVRDEKKAHNAEINELRDQHTKALKNEKSAHQMRMEKQREQQQQSYQKAIEDKTKQEAVVRQEQRKTTLEKNKEYENQRRTFDANKKQETEGVIKTHQDNQREVQLKSTSQINEMQKKHNEQVKIEQEGFETHRQAQRQHYEGEIGKEKDHYETQIRGRANEFENRYNEGEVKYQLTLEDQKLRYQDEYEKTKYKFLEKMKNYEASQKDPFYRVQDLGAELADEGSLYQIAVKVPEHELKNVKIQVQPDRITVSGARKYEQELQYEGEKVATNNYQTVRQEFQLQTPADKDLVRREYVDGVLFVTAPKKGFGIF